MLIAQSLLELMPGRNAGESGEFDTPLVARWFMCMLLGAAMSSVSCPRGIRDLVLLARACAGMMGFISFLSLPLGFEMILRWMKGSARKEWDSCLLYMPGVALSSFSLELVLPYLASYENSARISGLGIASLLVSRWFYRIFPKRSIEYREFGVGTICERRISLDLFQTEAVVITEVELPKTVSPPTPSSRESSSPLIDEKNKVVSSPVAETTPSDFSETRWMLDLSDDADEDVPSPHWFYIDLSGKVQGPFHKDLMRTWYTGGLLGDSLRVSPKPVPESTFTAIGALKAQRGGRVPFE